MGSWDVRVEERQFTRCQAGVPHRQPRVAAPSSTCHRLALVAFHTKRASHLLVSAAQGNRWVGQKLQPPTKSPPHWLPELCRPVYH